MSLRRFDAAAATYEQHARPQLALARELCARLPGLEPARILELGCGTGLLTRLLAKRYPQASIDAMDLAPAMLEQARRHWHGPARVRWICASAQSFHLSRQYPLIVSSAALHWVENLAEALACAFQTLEAGGWLGLGMMLSGTLQELWTLRREVAPAKSLPTFLPGPEEVQAALDAAGFALRGAWPLSQVEHYHPDAAAFLRALHEQGVTSLRPSGEWPLLSRRELRELIERYQKSYGSPQGVRATYRMGVFLARKLG